MLFYDFHPDAELLGHFISVTLSLLHHYQAPRSLYIAAVDLFVGLKPPFPK